MRFRYNTANRNRSVAEAMRFAERLSREDDFWRDVASLPAFAQTADEKRFTPARVASTVKGCADTVDVYHYTSSDPESTTTAYVSTAAPFKIFLNTRRLARSEGSHTNTLVHEFVHVVDCFRDTLGRNGRFEFGHDREYSSERRRSAPYAIGNLAQRHWRLAHGMKVEETLEGLEDYASAEGFACDHGEASPEGIEEGFGPDSW